jgi:cephalosporin-C deacetylase-like acetyl esterase
MQQPSDAITITTDRPEAVYGLQEEITFVAKVTRDGEPEPEGKVLFEIREDGMEVLSAGASPLSKVGAKMVWKLDKPGFIQCQVKYEVSKDTIVSATVGAGVQPLSIEPSLPVPDDFDSFWEEQKSRLAGIGIEATADRVESDSEDVDCFDVKVSCVDEIPVSGYLAKPKGASPGSLPAVLFVHGAGVRPAGRDVVSHAQHGLLALDINAHGLPNDRPAEFYEKLSAGELHDYRSRGREHRETVYFLGMFLRVKRALDYLTSQPEWDGKILVCRGSSQGGAQAIAGAGLDSRVTGFAAGVPAMCDHTGNVIGRASGWPNFVSPTDTEEVRNRVRHASRYFDMVNFASRTNADAIFSVGFIDGACNPTTVYAAYNNCTGQKEIIDRPHMGHEAPEDISTRFTEWTLDHVRRMSGRV